MIVIAALCSFAWVAPVSGARAEGLPHPYAPWMDEETKAPGAPATAPRKKMDKPASRAVLTPASTQAIVEKLSDEGRDASPLEKAYSSRIVENLDQFGYDLFGADNGEAGKEKTRRDGLPAGMAQDDFLLSSGDRVSITFTGQRSDHKVYAIDSQGFLIVDDLIPVPAAGLTLAQLREALEAQTANLHNTSLFISLDAVRQIDVLVVGHVHKPGRFTASVYHTVTDVLMQAGGVQKTGSLRQIKLVRQGRSTIIDLYGLLVHGSTMMDLQLRDGDRLIVPPIGPTLAVAGAVKRPAIYEILPGVRSTVFESGEGEKLSLQEALDLSGGFLKPGQNRLMKFTLGRDGREDVREITGNAYDLQFGDGAILMVSPSREKRTGMVELTGHTRRPGLHDLGQVKTLSALIDSEKVLGPDIYPLMGVIERRDDGNLTRGLIDFSPVMVLKGKYDRKLADGDVVHLFSTKQIRRLQEGEEAPPAESGSAPGDDDALPDDPALLSFLKERGAFIRGAVRAPGPWPVAEGTNLKALIGAAGGLTLEASTKNVEISSKHQPEGHGTLQRFAINMNETDPAAISVGPGDSVRINQKFSKVEDQSVLLIGEVNNPGRYDLLPGDTLSRLIQRAGGLNHQAYPDGAIFSREAERRAEEQRFRAAARDLERALAVAMDKEEPPEADQIALARDLTAELRAVEAVGRITVEADPGILSVQPELDILLEAGDRVYIPKRPLTVRVSGEVLSPASLQFRKEKDPRDYLAEAGGLTYNADQGRVFVVYPDGSAQPLLVSSWNHKDVMVPPGSTIVVPRDPKPFDFMQSARDLTQIISNLAVTGIFLDDLRDDN